MAEERKNIIRVTSKAKETTINVRSDSAKFYSDKAQGFYEETKTIAESVGDKVADVEEASAKALGEIEELKISTISTIDGVKVNIINEVTKSTEEAQKYAQQASTSSVNCDGVLVKVTNLAEVIDATEKNVIAKATDVSNNASKVAEDTNTCKTILNDVNLLASGVKSNADIATEKANIATTKADEVVALSSTLTDEIQTGIENVNTAKTTAITEVTDTKNKALEKIKATGIDGKQDKLIAGDNITIEDNVISSTGGIAEVTANDIVPIASKTYKNIYAKSLNSVDCKYAFASVKVTNLRQPYYIRVKITASPSEENTDANGNKCYQYVEYKYMFSSDQALAYEIENYFHLTTYKSVSAISYYQAKLTAVAKGIDDFAMFNNTNTYNNTKSTNGKDFKIELLETENCEVTFLEELLTQREIDKTYTATNFNNYYVNLEQNGLMHSADANTNTDTYDRTKIGQNYVAKGTVYSTQLVMSSDWNNYFSITNARTTATTKAVTQEPFRPETILYYSSTGNAKNGVQMSGTYLYTNIPIDIRYSINATSITNYLPIFLIATRDDSTGLYTLKSDKWWTQDIPTEEDGLYYIYLGGAYSTVSIGLSASHPVYVFKNGKFDIFTEGTGGGVSATIRTWEA